MIGDVASHLWTRREAAMCTDGLFWFTPDLSADDQRILAAKIDAWLDENSNKIPYSVAHPGGVIFKDDVWVGDTPGQGLTCATFIAELFNELGLPFIDANSWKQRPDDAAWAERILRLISKRMTPEHVEAQKARIGDAIRIRPSDIAAAGHLIRQDMEDPLKFEEVDPVRESIEAWLLKA
ncbi:hypothetical protein PQQ99_13165 [Paraburkholderia sediminicola]|uniref:hypothetical protein n=1 Tax=Paraburkholderia sediminicola TaxID=458836 RepID=UPI0038BD3FF8